MNQIISKADAKARGLVRYFTGKSCRRGHIAERYVSSGHCCECVWPSENKERRKTISNRSSANQKAAREAVAIAEGREPGKPGRRPKYATQEERLAARRQALRDWRARDPEYARAQHAEHMRNRTRKRAIAEGRIPHLLGHKASWTVEQHAIHERDMADGGRRYQTGVANQNARAKRLGIEGRITVRDVLDVLQNQAGNCAFCSRDLGTNLPEIDHWYPMSLGGVNKKHNIRLLHKTCNIMKLNRLPEEFFGGKSINWLFVSPELACSATSLIAA